MNIFYIDRSPVIAAQMQCDVHVVKMILETAQMLSTAHRLTEESVPEVLYKVTHKNHPSALWIRANTIHYKWAYQHFIALCDEYTRRYGRVHLTDTKLRDLLSVVPSNIPTLDPVAPPKCMPDEFQSKSAIRSYRLYYASKALSMGRDMTWTNATRPTWFNRYFSHLTGAPVIGPFLDNEG